MMNIRLCSVLITFAIFFTAMPGRAQNTFPANGRVGIFTLTPAASLQVKGGARIGMPGNYVNIDSATGNLSFAGTSGYQVGGNKYAFQYSGNTNYGLFFNSSLVQYEFRNGSAAPVFSVNANTGNSVFNGTLKIGAYTLPSTDGTSGQALTTNGSGTVKWSTVSGGSYTAGTGISISGNTITNTAPDKTVTLTGSGATTVSGTYPNFTISSTDNNTTYTAGSGLSLTGTTFSNTAPDQTVTLTGSNGITTSGTYPNFTISANGLWKTTGNSGTSAASNFIGTTDAIDFVARTNNTERMRITSAGNVGIGTSAPSGALNIVSTNSVSLTSAGYLQLGTASGINIGMDNTQIQARNNGTFNDLYLNKAGGTVYAGSISTSDSGLVGYGASYGLYGYSPNEIGVYGSGASYGVEAYASNGSGVFATGNTYGVYASSSGSSSSGAGVYGSGGSYGVQGNASNGTGVYGSSTNGTGVNGTGATGGSFSGTGYDGITASCSSLYGTGVYGETTGANATAVEGFANGNGLTYGVAGYVNDGTGEGVYGFSGSSVAYGMVAFSRNTIGLYSSTNNSGSYAGYFAGNVYSTGVYYGSDQKLKENIQDVSGAMSIIDQLHPKLYNFKQDGNYRYMHLPQGQHYGLIAQEVEKILPGLVKDTHFDVTKEKQMATQSLANPKTGVIQPQPAVAKEAKEEIDYKAMNYTELIPIMIKAMQEQQKQIDDLTAKVQRLTNNQSVSSATDGISATVTNITLSSASIDQNVPNPLSNTTSIHYFVPSGNAVLMISDASGKIMKQVSLATGAGNIAVDASTLSAAGAYSYTLLVDGKTIATRKMIVAR